MDDIGDDNELRQQLEEETDTFIAKLLVKDIFNKLLQLMRAIAELPAESAQFAEISEEDLEEIRRNRMPHSAMATTKTKDKSVKGLWSTTRN